MSSEMGGPDGFINDRAIDYYEARAKGGFAMVTTEYIAVQAVGKAITNQPMINDDKYIPGLSRLTHAIKRHGCRAMIQLQHSGRQTGTYVTQQQQVAPSVIVDPTYRQQPRELTTEEVYKIVEDFIKGAVRAKKAGFDIVELHAAHGYLLNQFLSPNLNKRIDEFGGGIDGRTYIVKLIIEGIKRECGADYPISVRCDTWEGSTGGYTENMALVYAKMFEEFGADAFHVSAGNPSTVDYVCPPSDFPPAWNLEMTKKLKSILGIPVLTVGGYSNPQVMQMVISNNYADIITVGRQSIADPEFPNKLFSKRFEEIIPCMGCNARCNSFHNAELEAIGDYGISCAANPFSPNRPELRMKPADKIKNIMVVGAGPGGLEAAWVAASRGHNVELYEKNPANMAGGQFLIASYPPYKQGITGVLRHYLYMCKEHGVNMIFDTEVDENLIAQKKPDVLIIATGAKPICPNFKGSDKATVAQANDVLTGKVVLNGRVLIVGGGQVGLETADFCTNYCQKVTIAEMLPQVGNGMNGGVLMSMLRRFRQGGIVDIHTNTKISELTADGAICDCCGANVEFKGYDSIIYAMGSSAFNPFENYNKLAKEVYIIGDANTARSATEAFFEAAKVAVSI
jgi:2,4-dienoyl-CoA reductase-like NADH-dependent reductase (Old Yellow Enzyme family)/thioredoxin reductase